jgi:hypothetical protein
VPGCGIAEYIVDERYWADLSPEAKAKVLANLDCVAGLENRSRTTTIFRGFPSKRVVGEGNSGVLI